MDKPIAPAVAEILATMEIVRDHIINAFMMDAQSNSAACVKMSVTLPQVRALETISANRGMNNKQLAEALHVSPASASAMVERLVELNLVERYIPDEDRRTVKLQLSPKGKKVTQSHRQVIEQVVSELLEQLGEKDARKWLQVGRKIRKVLSESANPQLTS